MDQVLLILVGTLAAMAMITIAYHRHLLHQVNVCREILITRLNVERKKRLGMASRLEECEAKLAKLDETLAEAIESSVDNHPTRHVR